MNTTIMDIFCQIVEYVNISVVQESVNDHLSGNYFAYILTYFNHQPRILFTSTTKVQQKSHFF